MNPLYSSRRRSLSSSSRTRARSSASAFFLPAPPAHAQLRPRSPLNFSPLTLKIPLSPQTSHVQDVPARIHFLKQQQRRVEVHVEQHTQIRLYPQQLFALRFLPPRHSLTPNSRLYPLDNPCSFRTTSTASYTPSANSNPISASPYNSPPVGSNIQYSPIPISAYLRGLSFRSLSYVLGDATSNAHSGGLANLPTGCTLSRP